MNIGKLSWILWVPGTILIVLSWMDVVSHQVGWIGFVVALVGSLLSWFQPSPRPAPSSPQGPASKQIDDLSKLADLRERGAISEEEFQKKKRELLDSREPGAGA